MGKLRLKEVSCLQSRGARLGEWELRPAPAGWGVIFFDPSHPILSCIWCFAAVAVFRGDPVALLPHSRGGGC